VLTEALTLKKIKLLDGVLEQADKGATGQDEGGFDADVAITTGELRQLIPDLLAALGGLHERQPVAPLVAPVSSDASSSAPWDTVPA
jgi:recombination associated protein RdgC